MYSLALAPNNVRAIWLTANSKRLPNYLAISPEQTGTTGLGQKLGRLGADFMPLYHKKWPSAGSPAWETLGLRRESRRLRAD
jgi:hypothetical protein